MGRKSLKVKRQICLNSFLTCFEKSLYLKSAEIYLFCETNLVASNGIWYWICKVFSFSNCWVLIMNLLYCWMLYHHSILDCSLEKENKPN